MNEEKETQEIQSTTQGQPTEEPASSLFEKTQRVVEQQKEENNRKEALIKREEELFARKQLGGYAEAGQTPTKPVEDTPEEYVKKIMSGQVGQ